jgi:hypothetical protein
LQASPYGQLGLCVGASRTRLQEIETNALGFSQRGLVLEWIEAFALPYRLSGTGTVRRKQKGNLGAGEREAGKNAGMLNDRENRILLKLLIFTAGNPSEGQQ